VNKTFALLPGMLLLLGLILPLPHAISTPNPPAESHSLTAASWELLTEIEPVQVWRSPQYANDATLYLTTERELRRSSDDGDSWTTLYTLPEQMGGRITGFTADPAPTTQTLFLSYMDAEFTPGAVLRSSDNGATWEWAYASAFGPCYDIVAARDALDRCVVYALTWSTVLRSRDCGDTWEPLTTGLEESMDLFRLFISPNYAQDTTLYLTGYGPLYRSTDAGDSWQVVHIPWADITRQVVFSPDYITDHTLWASYFWVEGSGDDALPPNGVVRSTDGGTTWEKINTGLPVDWPDGYILGLGVSPDYPTNPALYAVTHQVAHAGTFWNLYRSPNSGNAWWDQGPMPDAQARPTGLVIARPDLLLVPTQRGLWRLHTTCWEHLHNGGAEINAAWDFPDTPARADYSDIAAHSGLRSLRIGLVTQPNTPAYSSARQLVSIPADAITVTLSFWLKPLSTEALLARAGAPATGDAQYVLLLSPEGATLETLLWMKRSATWEPYTFDLSAYAGQTVRLHFGVYNDGTGGITGMYVDDVSLRGCRLPTTPPEPPLPLPLPRITSANEDFLITDAPSAQYRPALAYNGTDDETLLVWEDFRDPAFSTDVYAQRVSSTGQLPGSPTIVVTGTGRNPQGAYLGNAGVYLIVWEDHRNISQTPDIYGRLLDRHGQPVGGDFPIYSGSGYQGSLRIAASAPEGNFLVAWASSIDFVSSVWGQRVDATGNLLGIPLAISDGSGWAGQPALAYAAAKGNYVAVWSDTRDGPHNPNIYGQRISAHDGGPVGGNFPISTRPSGQVWPVIAIEPAGRMFVAWEEEWPGGGRDLYGRQLAADGTPLAQEFAIAVELGSSAMVAITDWTQADRQEFLVIWQTRTGRGDLAAQRYTPGGGPLGMPFFVSHEKYTQAKPAVVVLENAASPAYLVVWEDFRAGGPGGIYGQRVTPDGERLGLHVGLTPMPRLQTQPALAYSSTSDRTLVVWANVHGGGGNQSTHIMAYRFDSNNYLATQPSILTEHILTTTTQVAVDWDYWNDEFLVVWSDAGDIVGQVVAADGNLSGGNVTISALTGRQSAPVVAAGQHGYLVIFEHTHPLSLTTDIYGQPVTLAGAPLGEAVNISRLTKPEQQARNAHLAYNTIDNTFYVVWEETDPTSPGISLWNIMGQVVAGEDGSLLGPRRTLADTPDHQENHPRIAWAGPEDSPFYLLVWSAFDMHLGQANILARRLEQNGTPASTPYALTATQLEQELRPALSYDPFTRRFLAVWDASTQGMPYADAIWGVQLNAQGQPEGPAMLFVQGLDTARQAPVVTARRGHGEWLVAWEDGRADTALEHINIYGQRVPLRVWVYLPLAMRE